MFGFNRPYVRDYTSIFTPIYVPGENYSFYINSERIVDDADYADFRLYLENPDASVSALIGTPSVVFVAGSVGYNIYVNDFVCPNVPNGQYRLVIKNVNTEVYMFSSVVVLVSSTPDTILRTAQVKFRHNDKLYGVRYDLLPNFYQKFRLPLNQIKAPNVQADRVQYRQASNGRELRNSKSFRDIRLTIEFYYGSDSDMGALSAMLEHSEVYIAGNRIISMNQITPEKVSDFANLEKATFDVIVDTYGVDPDSLEAYGPILWGGTGGEVVTTFFDGNE